MSISVSVVDLRKELGEILNQAHYKQPVTISKRDKPFATVVSHAEGLWITDMYKVADEMNMNREDFREKIKGLLVDEEARTELISKADAV